MGFLVSFQRQMYLTNYVNDLEIKMTRLTEQKLDLTDQITEITTSISDIGDNDLASVKKLKKRQQQLEKIDKELDAQMKKMQTQLDAANTELKSAEKSTQNGIQRSFTYNVGGG